HQAEITVTGQCGSVTQSATLTVQPVTSASGPYDSQACFGQDVTLSTVASGVGPFNHQWTLDGNATGTDGPSLSVATGGLSPGAHTVQVAVSGQCGSPVTNT